MSSPSTADRLVELAMSAYDLGRDEAGEPFAIDHEHPGVALRLRGSRGLRAQLANLYRINTSKAPNAAALADALVVLEGIAADAPRRPVHLRVAHHQDNLVVDLGRDDGQVVVVGHGRWNVVERSPVLFRRTSLTGELPQPIPGGDLDELRDLLRISRDSWPLVVAWLVAALWPDVPHAVLSVAGEHGTGKSTLVKMLTQLVDPSPAPLRTAPRDIEGWAVAAAGSWVVAIDNLSTIQPWLSDALCRAVTGDGVVRRALYTDSDVSVLAFRRVVALTSIDLGSLRGDLGDRLVPVEQDRIPTDQRMEEAELSARFDQARPRLLGALLDIAAEVLAVLPDVRPNRLGRLADFHRIAAAVDRVTGLSSADAYLGARNELAGQVLEGDPVAVQLRAQLGTSGPLDVTARELVELLTPERPPRNWPTTPQGMAAALRRLAPGLRQLGYTVDGPTRDPGTGARRWHLEGPEQTSPDRASDTSSQSSQSAQPAPHQGTRRDDSRDNPNGRDNSRDNTGSAAIGASDACALCDDPAPLPSDADLDRWAADYPDLFEAEPAR